MEGPRTLVWVYIGAVVAACLFLLGCIVAAIQWHEKDVNLRVAVAKHDERCVALSLNLNGL
jgi:NADH:ubiquinone oxidoreductase subunit 6 (subunit J)